MGLVLKSKKTTGFYLFFFSILAFQAYFESRLLAQNSVTIEKATDMPEEVFETSELLYYNNLIWTFNDSGGEPELFGLSMDGKTIIKRVTLWNAYNYDWEDITQDSANVYIGDTGNNFGNRTNLCIYVIPKKKLTDSGNQIVKATKIFYSYPEYKAVSIFSFTKSSFDCEAMVYFNDSIYLFTKDWVTLQSVMYSVPAKPGKYMAVKRSTLHADGLITAADYDGKQLVLLGYKDYKAFIWMFKPCSNLNIDEQTGKRIELTELGGAQTEGLAIFNDNTLLISNEKSVVQQRFRKVIINR
jgi:hypothetical protein